MAGKLVENECRGNCASNLEPEQRIQRLRHGHLNGALPTHLHRPHRGLRRAAVQRRIKRWRGFEPKTCEAQYLFPPLALDVVKTSRRFRHHCSQRFFGRPGVYIVAL